jgi:hypothetical protein
MSSIAGVAAPRGHHREDEVPALAEETLVGTRVEGADRFQGMSVGAGEVAGRRHRL